MNIYYIVYDIFVYLIFIYLNICIKGRTITRTQNKRAEITLNLSVITLKLNILLKRLSICKENKESKINQDVLIRNTPKAKPHRKAEYKVMGKDTPCKLLTSK